MTLPHARNLPLRRSAIIAAAVAGPLAYAAQAAAAKVLGGFAGSIEKADPGAYVLLLGDLTSSGFSPAFAGLEAHGALVATGRSLPKAQQYDYVFDGDSEELPGLLASPSLDRLATFAGPVHFNAGFSGQTSDHDPLLAYFTIPAAR
jgi:predicted extracellular nuclease